MPAPPVGSVPAMDSTLAGAVGAGQGVDAGVGDMAVCREEERDSALSMSVRRAGFLSSRIPTG